MPYYDLRCKTCNKESNVKATIAQKTERSIKCPECGSTDMVTVFKRAPAVLKGGMGSGSDTAAFCPSADECENKACAHSRSALAAI